MNLLPEQAARLQFLLRVVQRECDHLRGTTSRLFVVPFTPARVSQLLTDAALAEQVEAFVSRFARLQDTLGDKLLPAMLAAAQEHVGGQIDNLDRAQRLVHEAQSRAWN
ncbi:MAG: hypothetical protein KA781_06860 [Aquabacterium sp.]|nr:hypothetical protein [Aquabacterium sp.]